MTPPGSVPMSPRSSIARLRAFHRDPLKFFQAVNTELGHRARFRMGPWTFWLLNDPESVRWVLTRHGQYFRKGPGLESSNPLIGEGLLTQEGDDWTAQRRRLAPVFKPGNVDKMAPWIADAADQFVSSLPAGQAFDLEQAMLDLSLTMAVRTIFADDKTGADIIGQIGGEVRWLMSHFYHRSRSVWRFPYAIPGFNTRYHMHARRLKAAVHHFRPQTRPYAAVWPALSSQPDLARQELFTLVIAGYETTGHALAWTLYLLSRHPDLADAVAQESRQSGMPVASTHPITDRVVKEGLRLYPPVWLMSRRAVLGSDMEDLAIEPGHIVLISPWLMQRSEDWFSQPERFSPERWEQAEPAPYSYIPFGAGSRGCIGENLALEEAMIALSRIAGKLIFSSSGAPAAVFPGLTLSSKNGIWMTAARR